MNHHRRGEWYFAGITGKAQEELYIYILSDLFDGLLVGKSKPLLDEKGAKRQACRLCRRTSREVELRCICFFQLFPRHQGGEEPPAVLWLQRAAKGT
jgi:hypothetical protein